MDQVKAVKVKIEDQGEAVKAVKAVKIEDEETAIREFYRQQKHEECLRLIEAAPESVKNSSQYKILQASCLNNLSGKSLEAHSILDDVIKREPLNALAYYGKGLVFINEGNLELSVEYFEKAIQADPSEKMNKSRHMKSRAERMLKSVKLEKQKARKVESDGESVSPKAKAVAKKKSSDKGSDSFDCPVCFKPFSKIYR